MIKIENSTIADISTIQQFYQFARDHQALKGAVSWPPIAEELIKNEIGGQHHWKLISNGAIAGFWSTTYSDPQIWEDRNEDTAIYFHRIAVNPKLRGIRLVNRILDWAKPYAKSKQKDYLRLDTVGNNPGLIKHYTECGFDFLGLVRLKNTEGLPVHYSMAPVCLFEMKV